MTLEEGKRKALMIIDEYSSGGTVTLDADINMKMNDFFDMAQKDMSNWKNIIRTITLTMDPEESFTELPEDFVDYYRVWRNGKSGKKYPVIDKKMFTNGISGEITIEYIASPATITPETPDTYEFENTEDANNCLPFYVAAQQLITDLVVDYSAIWQMYLTHRNLVNPVHAGGGTGRVVQALYG